MHLVNLEGHCVAERHLEKKKSNEIAALHSAERRKECQPCMPSCKTCSSALRGVKCCSH